MMILRKSLAVLSIASLFFIGLFIAPMALRAEEIPDTMKLAPAACPMPGEVPIGETDRPFARAAGIPDNVPCWRINDANTGRAVGMSKIYLSSLLCPPDRDNYGGAGSDDTIAKLNPGFAVCASNFLHAARATMDVCIHEGYRTPEMQQKYFERYQSGTGPMACDPRAKRCEHPSGIAIDVNTSSEGNYEKLWKLAPQFGLWFPHGAKDKYHVASRVEKCYAHGTGAPTVPPDQTLPMSLYEYVDPATIINTSGNPFQNALQTLQQYQLLSTITNFLKQNPGAQNPVIPSASPIYPTNNPSGVGGTAGSPVSNPMTIPRTNPVDIPIATTTPPAEKPAPQKTKVLSPLDVILQAAGLQDEPLKTGTSASLPVNSDIKDVSQVPPPSSTESSPPPTAKIPPSPTTATTRDLKDASFVPSAQTLNATEQRRFFSILDQLSIGLTRLSAIIAAPRAPAWIGTWNPAPARLYQ